MISLSSHVQKRQMNFLLSPEVVVVLNEYVPKGRQSQFVEKSIESSLSSLRFQDALKKSFGSWKQRYQSSEQFIRSLRKSSRDSR